MQPVYCLFNNSLHLPLEMIRQFSLDSRPSYAKYATYGVDIARSLSYAILGRGLFYDSQGLPLNYTSDIQDFFVDITLQYKCLRDKYLEINPTYTELHKLLTNGHNYTSLVADSWALSVADKAYEKISGGKYITPGAIHPFNYTNHQLFFIEYGISMCSKLARDVQVILDGSTLTTSSKHHINVNVISSKFGLKFRCPSSPLCQIF